MQNHLIEIKKKLLDKASYTLFDITISVSLILFLALMSLPIYVNFEGLNELDTTRTTLVQTMRNAQISSRGMLEDSSWGIKIINNTIVLFKGASYATRDTSDDLVYTIPRRVVTSGVNEVVFAKYTGLAGTNGTINLTFGTKTTSVTITSVGILSSY